MMNTYTYNPPHLTDANLWLNLDPNTITESSSAVSSWQVNLSGLDFTMTTASKKPVLIDSTNHHISFDGGDYLTQGGNTTYGASTGWTWAARFTSDAWDSAQAVIGDDNSSNGFIRITSNTSIMVKGFDGASAQAKGITIDTPEELVNRTFYNMVIQCNTSNNLDLWIDGVEQTASPSFASTDYNLVIDEIGGKSGATQLLTGDIQEIIMYNTVLTDVQVADIFAYLDNKF